MSSGSGPSPDRVTAVTVAGLHGATAIAAGDWHTCALVNGEVFCWGKNNDRQLGDGGTADRYQPAAVTGINHATAIAAGAYHTCALVAGDVKCWGSNETGQLGDGTKIERPTVVDVMGVRGATAIAAGAVSHLRPGRWRRQVLGSQRLLPVGHAAPYAGGGDGRQWRHSHRHR